MTQLVAEKLSKRQRQPYDFEAERVLAMAEFLPERVERIRNAASGAERQKTLLNDYETHYGR